MAKWLDRRFAWFKGRRTQFIAFLIGLAGIVQEFAADIVPDAYVGRVLFGIALLMYLLRQITTTPPGKKL